MGQRYPALRAEDVEFLRAQRLFFTASATDTSRVNVSPRSTEHLRVIDAGRVAYLDLTGSGNETAAHLHADGRLTLMACAFEGAPGILRLYGRGRVLHRSGPEYAALVRDAYEGREPAGARQAILLEVELVQRSCGYGVPLLDYRGERDILPRWAEARGPEGVAAYQAEHNRESLDGLPTHLLDPL